MLLAGKDLSELLENDNHTPSGQTNSHPRFPQLQPRISPPKATRSHHNVKLGSHNTGQEISGGKKSKGRNGFGATANRYVCVIALRHIQGTSLTLT